VWTELVTAQYCQEEQGAKRLGGYSLQVGTGLRLLSRDAKAAAAGLLVLHNLPSTDGLILRPGAECGADEDRR
jgi:hypothetical protein